MRILLTGATGMVGRKLGTYLVEGGHKLVVLARNPEAARTQLSYPCEIFKWEGESVVPPKEAFSQADAVIHLAGENIASERWTEDRKKRLRDSRIESAKRLSEALQGQKLKVFMTASGIGYYGHRGDEWLTEASTPGNDFLAQLCVEWEGAADRMPAERIMKARFGAVLAKDGGFIEKVVPMFKRFGASRLGMGGQWFSWIHIDDLCRLIVHQLADTSASGALNMVTPNPVTNAELTKTLGKAVGAWPGPPVPKFALQVMYGELAIALTGSQRVRSTKTWDFKFLYPTLEGALANLYPD